MKNTHLMTLRVKVHNAEFVKGIFILTESEPIIHETTKIKHSGKYLNNSHAYISIISNKVQFNNNEIYFQIQFGYSVSIFLPKIHMNQYEKQLVFT